MMPNCAYRRCKKAATTNLGTIRTPDASIPGGIWDEVVYVCDKHYKYTLYHLQLDGRDEQDGAGVLNVD